MGVTIKELSAACGLSVSTVSKALNGYPDISEETKALVERAAARMGYQPSAAARSLKTGRTFNLGVLYSDDTESGFTHNYFGPVLQAFKIEAERQGYDITFITHRIKKRPMTYLEHCRYRRVDGVCIVCSHFEEPEVVKLLMGELPVVTIDYVFHNRTCVQSENRQGLIDLTEYILARGHRRVAFAYGDNASVTDIRLTGFLHTMNRWGVPVPEAYLVPCRYHDPSAACEATRKLLALKEPPTCILLPDDYAAQGAVEAIHALGLRIPEDISIVGFDGVPWIQRISPRLTTMRQDTEAIGQEAARRLIALVEEPRTTFPQTISIPCSLIEGETVAAL